MTDLSPSRSQQFESTPILESLQARIGEYSLNSPSAMGAWLNGQLLAAEPGRITLQYTVRPEMTNPAHILHGGAAASMLDDVIGLTVYSLDRPEFFATIQLNIDYLSAAPVDSEVIAQSQLRRAGRTSVYANAELRTPQGKLLAQASSHLIASPYTRQATKSTPSTESDAV